MSQSTPRIVLASASPRRRELLTALGLSFDIVPSEVDEATDQADPVRVAEELALRKAIAVAAIHPEALVIGSDTVVALDGTLLGKPADAAEARTMLASLRARTHEVVTGVTLVHRDRIASSHARTEVTMRAYSDAEVDAFIASGSPYDKAGGYAIQDPDFAPVEAFDGCECNVIGLPLGELRRLLAAFGIETRTPAVSCDRCRVPST